MANRFDVSPQGATPAPTLPPQTRANRFEETGGVNFAQPATHTPTPQEAQDGVATTAARAWLDQHPDAAEGYGKSVLRQFATGGGMGWGDEAAALVRAGAGAARDFVQGDGPGFGSRYDLELAMQHELARRAAERTGKVGKAAEIAGNVAGGLMGGEALAAARGARAAPTLINGVLQGAGYGAAQGAGDAEGDRLGGLGRGAALGAAGGAAGHAIGAGAQRFAQATNMAPRVQPAASAQALRDEAQRHYQAFEQSGGRFTSNGLDDLASRLRSDLRTQAHYVPGTNPTVESLIGHAESWADPAAAGNVLPTDIQWLQQAGGLAGDINPAVRRLGYNFENTVDDWLTNASVAGGQIQAGGAVDVAAKDTADRLWRQASKAQTLERNIDRGVRGAAVTGSGGNETNKILQAINNTYNDLTKNGRRLTPDEERAFREAIHGNDFTRLMRHVGKLRFGGNGLMTGLNIAGLAASGGASAVIPGLGHIAEHLANRSARRSADEVGRVIRAGGVRRAAPTAPPNAAQRVVSQFRDRLPGPFGALFSSQLAPAPVKGGR